MDTILLNQFIEIYIRNVKQFHLFIYARLNQFENDDGIRKYLEETTEIIQKDLKMFEEAAEDNTHLDFEKAKVHLKELEDYLYDPTTSIKNFPDISVQQLFNINHKNTNTFYDFLQSKNRKNSSESYLSKKFYPYDIFYSANNSNKDFFRVFAFNYPLYKGSRRCSDIDEIDSFFQPK